MDEIEAHTVFNFPDRKKIYSDFQWHWWHFDAIKHIPSWFFKTWLKEMRDYSKKELFSVGEYWDPSLDLLLSYIVTTEGYCSLFDVPLHYNFHAASKQSNNYDLRTIFDNTLVKAKPDLAVTFLTNHDFQALQSLESVVDLGLNL